MVLGRVEMETPGEQIGRDVGVAVQQPEQAESGQQDERPLGRLEQRDGAQPWRWIRAQTPISSFSCFVLFLGRTTRRRRIRVPALSSRRPLQAAG